VIGLNVDAVRNFARTSRNFTGGGGKKYEIWHLRRSGFETGKRIEYLKQSFVLAMLEIVCALQQISLDDW